MRIIATLALLIASLTLAIPAFAADTPEETAIKGRHGEMLIRSFNLAHLFAMVKKQVPYDADEASKLAGNLKILQQLDMDLWVKGSSTDDYPDKTEALPKIWTSGSEFEEHDKDYHEAVNKLAEVAGDGLNALAPAAKDLAKACKACHDDFRKD